MLLNIFFPENRYRTVKRNWQLFQKKLLGWGIGEGGCQILNFLKNPSQWKSWYNNLFLTFIIIDKCPIPPQRQCLYMCIKMLKRSQSLKARPWARIQLSSRWKKIFYIHVRRGMKRWNEVFISQYMFTEICLVGIMTCYVNLWGYM